MKPGNEVSKKTFLIPGCIALLGIVLFSVTAQIVPPGIEWSKSFNVLDNGGTESDFAMFMDETADNGFILAGRTNSFGPHGYDIWDNTEAWVVRLDSVGNLLWMRTYGIKGTGDEGTESAPVVRQLPNGNFIFPVVSDAEELWRVQIDKDGNEVWIHKDTISKFYSLSDLIITADNGFLMLGEIEGASYWDRNTWLTKFDSAGTLIWEKQYVSENASSGLSLHSTHNGDSLLILAKTTFTMSDSTLGDYMWLIRTNSEGDSVWSGRYAGIIPYSSAITAEGGLVVTGSSSLKPDNGYDIKIIKCNAYGDSVWAKTYSDNLRTVGNAVAAKPDSNIVVIGRSQNGSNTESTIWLLMLNSQGDTLWTQYIGDRNRSVYSIISLSNGNNAIAGAGNPDGYTGYTDLWFRVVDNGGTKIHERFYGGRTADRPFNLSILDNNRYLLSGRYEYYGKTFGALFCTDTGGSLIWKKTYFMPAEDLIVLQNGDFLFGGMSDSGFTVIKTNDTGEVLFQKHFPAESLRYFRKLMEASNSGYYMFCNKDYSNLYVYRLDEQGEEVWSTPVAGQLVYSIIRNKSGDFIMQTESNGLICIDTSASILWQKSYPNNSTLPGEVHADFLVQTEDDSLTLFAGIGAGSEHLYLVRTDASGNEGWFKAHENITAWYGKAKEVNTNEYIYCTSTRAGNDKYMLYLDNAGEIVWERVFEDTLRETFRDFYILGENKYIALCHEEDNYAKDYDFVLYKLGLDSSAISRQIPFRNRNIAYGIMRYIQGKLQLEYSFPEIKAGDSPVELKLFSTNGQLIKTIHFKPAGVWPQKQIIPGTDYNGTPLSSGFYLGQLVCQKSVIHFNFILID